MNYKISLADTAGRKIRVCWEADDDCVHELYLYPGDLRKYGLKDGMSVSEAELEKIRQQCAVPRAKKRALGILVRQDKTIQELREKLLRSDNDSRSVEEALCFVAASGYADDERYARDYLNSRRHKKSFRLIRLELQNKGIAPDILERLFEEEGDQAREDVEEAVRKYMHRFEVFDRAARDKTLAHFYRKGYSSMLIKETVGALAESK